VEVVVLVEQQTELLVVMELLEVAQLLVQELLVQVEAVALAFILEARVVL
jgi:hypothetical protein